jgi:hypothetical protein
MYSSPRTSNNDDRMTRKNSPIYARVSVIHGKKPCFRISRTRARPVRSPVTDSYPPLGKMPRTRENSRRSMIPSTNSGIEYSTSELVIEPMSRALPRRQPP